MEARNVMEWLVANWFWVLIFVAFIALHLFGHGGHGGHHQRHHQDRSGNGRDEGRVVDTSPGGHSH